LILLQLFIPDRTPATAANRFRVVAKEKSEVTVIDPTIAVGSLFTFFVPIFIGFERNVLSHPIVIDVPDRESQLCVGI